jgi:maleate cis-trans isomerase
LRHHSFQLITIGQAFLASEGFDVLGESLDTGMTSLEKALLAPTRIPPCASGREKICNLDAVLITSSARPTLTVIQALEDDLGRRW